LNSKSKEASQSFIRHFVLRSPVRHRRARPFFVMNFSRPASADDGGENAVVATDAGLYYSLTVRE